MRLGLHVLQKTLDQYLQDLASVAEDAKTLVFLDTNILGYLYKLHTLARKEFFAWVSELTLLDGRLFIPAWAANEYLAKFKARKFSEYAPSGPEQVFKQLNNLHETASLFVDSDVLKQIKYTGTRDAFLGEFDSAIKALGKFTCVFSQQFDAWSVHEDIATILSDSVLNSNLAQLCSKAHAEGDARITHRLPPGYKDSTKLENKFGDLIIWYEILLKAETATKEEQSTAVLFITNDEKPDWVYTPAKRLLDVKGQMKQVPNTGPAIKLPDPILVAEFHASVGHNSLHLATLPMLITALSTKCPQDFQNLAQAIQIETGEQTEPEATEAIEAVVHATSNADVSAGEITVTPTPSTAETSAQETAEYPQEALRDGAYEADAPGLINDIIRPLKSHNWYVQNPAIQRIRELRAAENEPSQLFVLGRNIYQAACGNAQKALEFLKNLDIELMRFSEASANHILAGMTYEIYFDRDGEFRRHPKAAHIDQILREISKPRYARCRAVLLKYLDAYRDLLPFKPGDTTPLALKIAVVEIESLVSESGGEREVLETRLQLQSVKFLDKERLCEESVREESTGFHSRSNRTTVSQIKSELVNSYAIPNWGITVKFKPSRQIGPDQVLYIPEGKTLSLDRIS